MSSSITTGILEQVTYSNNNICSTLTLSAISHRAKAYTAFCFSDT